jgi:NAD(P)-dependent dehydrogenase (short-subunit alcohol dehydrogenase family)
MALGGSPSVLIDIPGPGLRRRSLLRPNRASTEPGAAGGVIVNTSSIAAQHGSGGERVHYSASKEAINIFTVGFAKEVGCEGIRVTP